MKSNSGMKWILAFGAIVLAAVIVLMAVCYVVDPFFAYRVRDNSYKVPDTDALPGIIKHHSYDTLIIGSSMTQNFEMDSFREKLNVKPAKISTGGMVLQDTINLTALANRTGKAKKYYICLDLPRFLNDGKKAKVKDYLVDNNIFNDYKYLLGYSAWTRYIPVDLALLTAKKIGISIPKGIEEETEIDEIGYWGDSFRYGTDIVVSNYKKSQYSVSEVDSENAYDDIVENTDLLMNSINFENCEYNFFFPPYSILYWCNADEEGYFEDLLKGKEYLVKSLKQRGCNIYDFQHVQTICELNNYRDITHYTPQINEWMVDCFSTGAFLCSGNDVSNNNEKIIKMMRKFRKENPDIFEK